MTTPRRSCMNMIGTGIVVSHAGLGYQMQILCTTNHVLTCKLPKLGTILFFLSRYSVPVPLVPPVQLGTIVIRYRYQKYRCPVLSPSGYSDFKHLQRLSLEYVLSGQSGVAPELARVEPYQTCYARPVEDWCVITAWQAITTACITTA